MYKEFILQIERLENSYLFIIILLGWILFLLTYIFRRRKMQNILNRLERELKENNEKIRTLEGQLNSIQKSKTNLEIEIKTLKKHHPDLTSANQDKGIEINQESVNKVEHFEKEWLFTEYENNFFEKKKGKNKSQFNNEVVYGITLHADNKGTFELVNKENDDYILNKDLYLLPGLCSLNYSNNSSRKKIGSIIPGKVHLDGDKWIVDEKVKIEIL